MNVAEHATLYFYEWDYRHRGYYFYDTPVSLEPPYRPYYIAEPQKVIDDSKVSLSKMVGSLFDKKEEVKEPEVPLPKALPLHRNLRGIVLQFPKNPDVSVELFSSFLSMLSYSEYNISLEIVATGSYIQLQLVFCERDSHRIQSHLQTYFPSVRIHSSDELSFPFSDNSDIAIVDFGLSEEFVRPLRSEQGKIDSLTSLFSLLDNLKQGETVVYQTIFKGISSPLAKDIPRATTSRDGKSFFYDAPEMPKLALEKVNSPLYAVMIRLVVQSNHNYQTQALCKELSYTISHISDSGSNKLIPLSNEGYDINWHIENVVERHSNRCGMILNLHELSNLIHIPHNIHLKHLGGVDEKTKKLTLSVSETSCEIGVNIHQGEEINVFLDTQMRLRHTHIIGATGTGKSTLMANMILSDIEKNIGCVLFDPHGDIIDDILARIPENKQDNIVIVDPSDADFPIGFNLLEANTELEKIQLSSDLVSAFKQHATSWGDQMTAVLSNAINTFLESNRGGTLLDLKRLLLEPAFRYEFLNSVEDASIHYYWKHEYPAIAGKIAPLLTRIDTFLRPKIVRYMMAQRKGLDMRECIDRGKTVLIKLSQGLIGEENSYLLGSLFLSKINQVALSRQSQSKDERKPYYIYLDEFQNFITPSIVSMLSGSRKYGIGLILAHQDLGQIDDTKVLNSVLSNPFVRICFRVGDADSVKLESSFSFFDRTDLQSLPIGSALVRIGSANNDCNIQTYPLPDKQENHDRVHDSIINETRKRYCTPRAEVEELIQKLMESSQRELKEDKKKKTILPKEEIIEIPPKAEKPIIGSEPITDIEEESVIEIPKPLEYFDAQKEEFIKKTQEVETIRKHRTIQNYVKTIAVQRGYKVSIEHELPDGKRIDVALIGDSFNIGIEISDTNSPAYEVGNIKKCFEHGYKVAILISDNEKHLNDIKSLALSEIESVYHPHIYFLAPEGISLVLDSLTAQLTTPQEKPKIRGYRVKTNYVPSSDHERGSLTDIVLDTIRRK